MKHKHCNDSATNEIAGCSRRARATPPELRCLFMLQPLSLDCFVFRILVGLSPEVCAELLDVSITDLGDAVCASNQLPLLSSSTV